MIALIDVMKEESFAFQLDMINFQSQFVFESNLFYFNESEGIFYKIKESLKKFIDKVINFFRNIFSKNVEKVSANVNNISKQSNETQKTNPKPSQEEKPKTQSNGETITVASFIWLSTIVSHVNQYVLSDFNEFNDFLIYFSDPHTYENSISNKFGPYRKQFKNEGIHIGISGSKTVEEAHANFKEELEGTNMVALVKNGELKITSKEKEKLIERTKDRISDCNRLQKNIEKELIKFKQSLKKIDDDISNSLVSSYKGLFIDLSNIVITSTNICIAYLTDTLIELNKTVNAVKKVERMFNI